MRAATSGTKIMSMYVDDVVIKGAAGPQGLGVEYQRHFWPDTSKPASGKIRGLALGSIQDACPDNCFTRVINFSGGQGFSRKLTFNPPYSSSASGNPVTTSTGMREWSSRS